jgi:hypothetical protein
MKAGGSWRRCWRAAMAGLWIALALCAGCAEARAECRAEFAGAPAGFSLPYNPFEAAPAQAELRVRVRNIGADACRLALAAFGPSLAAGSGQELVYSLETAPGEAILNAAPAPPRSLAGLNAALLPPLEPGREMDVPLRAIAAAGQVVPPGHYDSAIALALYNAASGAIIAEHGLSFAMAVAAALRIEVAGGGQGATLDFGALAAGASRTIILKARANLGFALTLASDHEGALILDPPAADGLDWRAPYRLAVDGGPPVSLSAPRTIPVSSAPTPLGGRDIAVTAQLDGAKGLRAGLYRDVVTISINAPN